MEKSHALQAAIIALFANSPNFIETKKRFSKMNEMVLEITEVEINTIIAAYRKNSQLYNCGYLNAGHNRVLTFLTHTSGKYFSVEGRSITVLDI